MVGADVYAATLSNVGEHVEPLRVYPGLSRAHSRESAGLKQPLNEHLGLRSFHDSYTCTLVGDTQMIFDPTPKSLRFEPKVRCEHVSHARDPQSRCRWFQRCV